MTRITICGAGNAAHTLVPLLAAKENITVTVFAPLGDEAARWQALLDHGSDVDLLYADGPQVVGRPEKVTADPAVAAAGADLVLLALPAFAHEEVLRSLAPYLLPRSWVGALPARGGFDWLAREALPHHQGTIFGLQTLPWACRIRRWGLGVEVLGTKNEVDLAALGAGDPVGSSGDSLATDVARELGRLLDVNLRGIPGFLALTLANTGQLIHPGIMYGLFHDWDGLPLDEHQVPLFYSGVGKDTARVLQELSDEVQALRTSLESLKPQVDLSAVEPLETWLHRSYAGQMEDVSTLQSSFNSNRAYAGLKAPVRPAHESRPWAAAESQADDPGAKVENRYEPWFTSRYLSEDVPYGLLVTRGIAELAGVEVPTMDRVLAWAQGKLGKEYLVQGRVAGRDLTETRAPQRFGINTLEALVQTA